MSGRQSIKIAKAKASKPEAAPAIAGKTFEHKPAAQRTESVATDRGRFEVKG